MKKIALAAIVSLLVGCNTVADFFVSDADEKEIGRQYHSQLKDSLNILPSSTKTAQLIDSIGYQLAKAQDRYNFSANDFTFSVVDDDVINAFAVPGGYIYIYTGLLEKAGSLDQIAGVLAHEIGHVAAEHYKEQVIKINGLNFLASLIGGKTTTGEVAKAVGLYLTQMKMSRNNEYEADSLAIAYLAEDGGYSPWGMKHFLDTLNTLHSSLTFEILSTHPDSDKRAVAAQELINADFPQFPESGDNTSNPFN